MTATRVLVVEDDQHILLGLREVLASEGYDVVECARGDAAFSMVQKEKPDLILLDIMLPGASGFDICKKLRASNIKTPIIMLTAKGQELDKVVGLDLGADDYITKPFGVRELLARIKAVLRRAPSSESSNDKISIGNATIDLKKLEVHRDRTIEPLTPREAKLLKYLYNHSGEVASRDQLLNEVWGYNYYGTTRTLDQVIVQLRKKLGDDGHKPRHLLTVHGVGYRLVP